MRIGLLLVVTAGCGPDGTQLADLTNVSLALGVWDCADPNVPLGCDQPVMARLSIGGDGIGPQTPFPCVTLSDDVRVTIDGVAMNALDLGGEYENECEEVVFLGRWETRPAGIPTSTLTVADGNTTLAVDLAHLFGDRRIEIVTPTRAVQPGDHVEARVTFPSALDAIVPGTTFVCDGACPGYLPFTISGQTISFDIPANARGPIRMGTSVSIPVERCDVASCAAITSVSTSLPLTP